MDAGDWAKLILMMAAILILTAVVVGVGAYVFLRVFASLVNSKQSSWESPASALGFTVKMAPGSIYKTFAGDRKGFKIEINRAALNTRIVGKMPVTDDGAEVTVFLQKPLNFPFELAKREMLHEKLGVYFDEPSIGHEAFDKIFQIDSPNTKPLAELLNVEMLDAETPTLLTDLMVAAKNNNRVVVTDQSVTLTRVVTLGNAEMIDRTIDRAIYLAERLAKAAEKSSPITATSADRSSA